MRKMKLFIACSLDGYIASKDGDISFLNQAELPGEDYGYTSFLKTIDTVIMGRKTYEKIISFDVPFPHPNETVYVFSSTLKGKNEHVIFVNNHVETFIENLKATQGKDIFLDGGAQLIKSCLTYQLIDEMIITILPLLLGDGIPLFLPIKHTQTFSLIKEQKFSNGLIQLTYQKNTNKMTVSLV